MIGYSDRQSTRHKATDTPRKHRPMSRNSTEDTKTRILCKWCTMQLFKDKGTPILRFTRV